MKACVMVYAAILGAQLLLPAGAFAQSTVRIRPTGGTLFIDSDPIGATVLFDGKALPEKTPILLRDVKPGQHSIGIAQPGYAPWLDTIEIKAGKVSVVDRKLSDQSFIPRFNSADTVFIGGVKRSYKGELYKLPEGDYRITKQGTKLSIEPIFPAQQLLDITNVTTGLLLGASAISGIDELLTSQAPGGGLIALYISTGVMALTDTLFNYKKSQFLEGFKVVRMPERSVVPPAREQYGQAQQLLASNELSAAADAYTKLLQDHPDSSYFPKALYQLSKIHSIEGNDFLAGIELRLILAKYPAPALYDKSCKSLADVYYRLGDYRAAIDELDKMVFIDPLFTRAQITEYRAAIEKKLKAGGSGS
jgi:hypothetical protein